MSFKTLILWDYIQSPNFNQTYFNLIKLTIFHPMFLYNSYSLSSNVRPFLTQVNVNSLLTLQFCFSKN